MSRFACFIDELLPEGSGLLVLEKHSSKVLVWEPVSKQKRLLGISKNSALNLGTYLKKNTFLYHIKLEDLKKINLVAFLCVS